MAGLSGIGRHVALTIVSAMHGVEVVTPKLTNNYTVKQFKDELKRVMAKAGVEGEQVVLLLEDFQFVNVQFLEMINSLLSSGEIPGLFEPNELDAMLNPLRDLSSNEGYRGSLAGFFALRVKANLHVVLIMDSSNPEFSLKCESNPAIFKTCTVLWMESWSKTTMMQIPDLFLKKSRKFCS